MNAIPTRSETGAIGRLSFLVRFLPFVLLIVAVRAGVIVSVAYALQHLGARAILAGIALLWLLSASVCAAVLLYRYALIPRLSDIGFRGPLRTIVAFLWFVPPTNPFVLLALLLVPAGFVQEPRPEQTASQLPSATPTSS